MIGSLAGDRGTLVKWEMLDGIDSPPVCELQLMCGHYYLFDIDPSLSGWYEARRKIGMDMDEDDVLGPDHSVVPKFLLEHAVFRIWNFRTTTCLVVCCRLCCSMMVVPAGSYVPWLPW